MIRPPRADDRGHPRASVALHEKLGFSKVGQLKEVGRKFDQWIDVGYWQKIFG